MYRQAFVPVTGVTGRVKVAERQLLDLLRVLRDRGAKADFGLVPRNTCRLDLGMDGFELDALLRRARQLGLVDVGQAYDHVVITQRGIERLGQGFH
ncbi:MAG: hypothetical protein PHS60_10250 [Zavarzinia sp.]|nr:hypothetical protein [Zavarzinia sp.]